jgi:hypothetical protein
MIPKKPARDAVRDAIRDAHRFSDNIMLEE